MKRKTFLALLAGVLVSVTGLARADLIRVAVSANFRAVAGLLAQDFELSSGHKITLSSGPTGGLYNQITHGAPFDLFLSADSRRPQRVLDEGLAADAPRTYALGRLVLWAPGQMNPGLETLKRTDGRIAIANPQTAPYGQAAMEVLDSTGLSRRKSGQIVQGGSVQQTWQFVKTGNAGMGFIAFSQLKMDGVQHGYWMIPENLYKPIRQNLVVLTGGKSVAAARQFANYILQPKQQALIEKNGYHSAASQ